MIKNTYGTVLLLFICFLIAFTVADDPFLFSNPPSSFSTDNKDKEASSIQVRGKKQQEKTEKVGSKLPDNDYYLLVDEVLNGINHYTNLELEFNPKNLPGVKEIRKAFRRLSLIHHPDKASKDNEESEKKIFIFNRAYEVLTTPDLREVYDSFLLNGVPWKNRFIGRWAHNYGIKRIPLSYVGLGFLVVLSSLQYSSQYFKYQKIHRLAKSTTRFKTASNLLKEEPQLKIDGLKPASVVETLLVQIYLIPWGIGMMIYQWFQIKFMGVIPESSLDKMLRDMNMSREEFGEAQRKQAAKMQKMMQSTKYKRYLRAVKKARKEQAKMQR